jgi:hypothetical protein
MEEDAPLAGNGEVLDLFGQMRPLPPTTRRVVAAGATIMQEAPDRADFLHAILCQVGMPRKATPGRVFERSSGGASMMLEAGKLWTGRTWREVPLPYGTRPRLVMVHVSSEAVRTRSREIHIGDSRGHSIGCSPDNAKGERFRNFGARSRLIGGGREFPGE